jgi:hypothetical protein
MPNYQGVWSLSTQMQNRTGWPEFFPSQGTMLIGGGYTMAGALTNTIQQIDINEGGATATDFGDLTEANYGGRACSSATRAVFMGGNGASNTTSNVMAYVTVASAGNATDFGDLNLGVELGSACNSATRGINGGGMVTNGGYKDNIQYFTIASTGNASDFGNLSQAVRNLSADSSSTRGVFFRGFNPSNSPSGRNTIEYITIASTGNATDFGDSNFGGYSSWASCGSGVRSLDAKSGNTVDVEYITIASTGNATDFGDLNTALRNDSTGASGPTTALFQNYIVAGSGYKQVESFTIATTGNAVNYGDLAAGQGYAGGTSNSNGGLQ